MKIATRVLAVFAVMAAGVGARRVGWLTREADKSLMRLAVNVMLPCLFFSRVLSDPPAGTWSQVAGPPLVGFGTTVAGFVLAGLAAALLHRWARLREPSQRRAFTLCTGMYNYGYIPLPIAIATFPDAVTTLIVHNVGVEIALWTVGLLVISGGLGRDAWRRMINPPVVAISLALVLVFTGLAGRAPRAAMDLTLSATRMLGDASIPLGLVLSGAVIYDLWSEGDWLAEWRGVALAAALRLLVLPALFLVFAKTAGLGDALKQVVILQAAMPAATFPLVLTRLHGQDTATAFRVIIGTTVLGVVTIPLWIAVGCWYLGMPLPR